MGKYSLQGQESYDQISYSLSNMFIYKIQVSDGVGFYQIADDEQSIFNRLFWERLIKTILFCSTIPICSETPLIGAFIKI